MIDVSKYAQLLLKQSWNPDLSVTKYCSWSPYHYSGNSPVMYLDAKGLNWFTNKKGDHGNIKAYNNFMKHLYKLSSNPIGLKINYYLLSK